MPRRGRSWFREMLLGNWKNKGVALFLAVVVWFVGYRNTEATAEFEAAAKIVPNDKTKEIIVSVIVSRAGSSQTQKVGANFTGQVRLELAGQNNQLGKVGYLEGIFTPDEEGRIVLTDDDKYDLPAGISIQSADPSELQVVVDRLVTEAKPVRLNQVGLLDARFRFNWSGVTIEPETVTLVGPAQQLDGIDEILTELFDLSTLDTEFSETTLRLAPESLAWLAEDAPREVQVSIGLQNALKESEHIVRVRYGVPAERFNPYSFAEADESVTLIVMGTEEQIAQWKKNVDSGWCEIYVPVREFKTDPQAQTVSLADVRFPEGSLAGVKPLKFQDLPLLSFRLKERPSVESQD